MKKLFLPCAVFLLAFLTSCVSEHCWDYPNSGTGTGNYSTISLSLRIVEQPETRGESLPIADQPFAFNTGDLFLVNSIGIIVEHYTIVAADASVTTLTDANLAARVIHRNLLDGAGVELPEVPGNTYEVVIIGNTPGNPTTGNINSILIGRRPLDIATQHDARNANLFDRAYVTELPTPTLSYSHTAELSLRPTVARIELGDIRAASDIASFRLEGIFVNNFYRWATVDGTAQNTVVHSVITNWAEAQRFTQGSALFPIALEPTVFDWYDNRGMAASGTPLRVSPSGNNVWSYQVFAQEENSTTVPSLVIRLRDIVLQDGRMLPNPQFLIVELYENESPFNRLTGINAGCVYRIPAVVFGVEDLLAYDPEMDPATPDPATFVTTFTNVMYDFQSQLLHTNIHTGAATPAPIAFQWQVSRDNVTFSNIDLPGASGTLFANFNSGVNLRRFAEWTLPANFIHKSAQFVPNADGNLYFRTVKMTEEGLVTQANALRIHFVRTTQTGNDDFLPGFGIDTSVTPHVRYARLARAGHSTGLNTTMRVALLNLGVTETSANPFGYLFQWGRRADGHQVVNWHIRPDDGRNHFNNTNTVLRSIVIAEGGFDATTGQPVNNNEHRFIRGSSNWSNNNFDQWGRDNFVRTGIGSRPTHAQTLARWEHQENNPCPPGWRVPSIFDWDDMKRNNGLHLTTTTTTIYFDWRNNWRIEEPSNLAAGAAIARNITDFFAGANDGATVIFPASGWRHYNSGYPNSLGATGGRGQAGFWSSSTYPGGSDINSQADRLWVAGGSFPVSTSGQRGNGRSVRCVAD